MNGGGELLLTAGCDSAAGPAESVGGQVSCGMGPSPQASLGETQDYCHIPGGPWLVPGGSYG